MVGFSFHNLPPALLCCSAVKETEKTSGAPFILCDAFNVRFYAMESAPYGCLYHDLYSNDYTEPWSNYFCVDHHARQISQRFKLG